jgi:hypothetical protein
MAPVGTRAAERRFEGGRIMALSERARQKKRLLRQFAAMERRIPALRRPLRALLSRRGTPVRWAVALLMILGGLLSFLPFLGIWMLPLGVLLLAVDVPALRPAASGLTIRGRRWARERLRRLWPSRSS